ncbi:MAG: SDR family oxidoreductase [Candidatus Heimdallarchaeota archaeon]|nr:SDR family oxidoreductase [Candidatus Heimdallarchaeota archaeon]
MALVVITGSTSGIGKALAHEFLRIGDIVILNGRNQEKLDNTLELLNSMYPNQVFGFKADINNYDELVALTKYASSIGNIDYWINNAGIASQRRSTLYETDPEDLREIIETNLTSSILATKAALLSMRNQSSGHLFLMAGMGTTGRSSPNSLAYGVSKAGYKQLLKTLVDETKNENIGIHMLSPGMVLTKLIMQNYEPSMGKIFNILCEQPSTVAKYLVPRIRSIDGTGKNINFLKTWKVMLKFLTASRYKNRFFDNEGNPVVEFED